MKDLKFSALLDLYGKILTEKQYAMMEQYYHLDYSLSEIAENESVSRQAVHASLKQAQSTLSNLEEKLGFYEKCANIQQEINRSKETLNPSELKSVLEKIETLI